MGKVHISYSEYAQLFPNNATLTEWVIYNWIKGGKEDNSYQNVEYLQSDKTNKQYVN